ncbi:hypothetical protein [Azospirillum sp.]|uniref:hypothetical protein n=1 Tax=Azospirillum sp. TaxID=34012 RepID=UPI002D52B180|nr:hypothetical protein [Azospirillum sp.]HYF89011.1 hypothetical protein [Azospirillum sp.]
MDALTEQQASLMASIPGALGMDPTQKDWAPVMSRRVWDVVITIPDGLVETHRRFLPILPIGPGLIGVGFARLTEAGRAAVAARGEA